MKKIREAEEERSLVEIASVSQQSRSLQWGVQQRVMKDRDMLESRRLDGQTDLLPMILTIASDT